MTLLTQAGQRPMAWRARPAEQLRRLLAAPALQLALLAVVLYLPSALRAVQLSPDAVEYLDIARSLAAGSGYLLSVKAYHVGPTEVVHNGLAERSPLFPYAAALVLRLGGDLHAVQVMNAFLAAACASLVYQIGATVFGRRSGVLAGLLAVASPVVLTQMVPPMTEALTISLILLAIWLVLSSADAPRPLRLVGAGVALGLAYLTRPTAVVVLPALVLAVVVTARSRRDRFAHLGLLLASLVVAVAPLSIYSAFSQGSLSYSGQTYLYSVFRGSDVRRNGYVDSTSLPSPAEFIGANREFVVAAVANRTASYLQMLLLEREWLLPFFFVWPVVLLTLLRGRYPPFAWVVLLAAAGNFLVYALTWSTYQDRYQLLTLLLLLPFAVDGVLRLGLGELRLPGAQRITALHLLALGITLAWLPTFLGTYRGDFSDGGDLVPARTDYGITWTGPPQWVEDEDLDPLLGWVEGHTEPTDILAHAEPWLFTFFTGRPATLLPADIETRDLRRFLVDYRVAYVLLDRRDRDFARHARSLDQLKAGIVRPSSVDSVQVFATGYLWR